MSTRSCIARPVGDGWEGVYHHSDGYPSGLGCYLFRLIHYKYKGDIAKFLEWAIDKHDGGWSAIFPSELHGNGKIPICYCHGEFAKRDGTKPGDKRGVITSRDENQLSIEYVYILDPESRLMTILGSEKVAKPAPGEPAEFCAAWKIRHMDGTIEEFPASYYVHRPRGQVPLNGPEPNWLEIECGPKLEHCPHYRCLHGATGCKPDCPYCHGTGKAPTERLLNGSSWVDDHFPPVR